MVRIESVSYWISKRCNPNLGEAVSILEDKKNLSKHLLKIKYLKHFRQSYNKLEPSFILLSTVIKPLCLSIIFLQINKPTPVPSYYRNSKIHVFILQFEFFSVLLWLRRQNVRQNKVYLINRAILN